MTTNAELEPFAIAISSTAAYAFLDAHMHTQQAELYCQHATSGDHDDEPQVWFARALLSVEDAEAAIHDFVREVRGNGIGLVLGTFGPIMRELTQRLDAARYQASVDLADQFVWSEPVFAADSPVVRHLNAAPARES